MTLMLRVEDHVQGQEVKTINEFPDTHPNICDSIYQELSRGKAALYRIETGSMRADQVLRRVVVQNFFGWL